MAGQRQYSNLIALFDNFPEYQKALQVSQNSLGTLQNQEEIYLDSTAAHLKELKAAAENLYDSVLDPTAFNVGASFGKALLNTMARLVDSLGGGMGLLTQLGGLATVVFRDKIASGVMTSLHNIQLQNLAIQEEKDSLAAMAQMRGMNDGQLGEMLDVGTAFKSSSQGFQNIYQNEYTQIIDAYEQLFTQKNELDALLSQASQSLVFQELDETGLVERILGGNFNGDIEVAKQELNELYADIQNFSMGANFEAASNLLTETLDNLPADVQQVAANLETVQGDLEESLSRASQVLGDDNTYVRAFKKEILELQALMQNTNPENLDTIKAKLVEVQNA